MKVTENITTTVELTADEASHLTQALSTAIDSNCWGRFGAKAARELFDELALLGYE